MEEDIKAYQGQPDNFCVFFSQNIGQELYAGFILEKAETIKLGYRPRFWQSYTWMSVPLFVESAAMLR